MGHPTGLFSIEKLDEDIDRAAHAASRSGPPGEVQPLDFTIVKACPCSSPGNERICPAFPCFYPLMFSNRQLSSPRSYSAPRLWKTLRKAALSAGRKTLLTALTLFYCLQDRDTPTWAKGVIVGALGYLILPADLIPDIIPGIGYGDDWGAIVAALGTVTAYIKDEHKTRAASQVIRLLGDADVPAPPEFFE